VGRVGTGAVRIAANATGGLRKTELQGYSMKSLAEKAGSAYRHCYPVNIKQCFSFELDCGTFMMT
jgi:hypothetical protein